MRRTTRRVSTLACGVALGALAINGISLAQDAVAEDAELAASSDGRTTLLQRLILGAGAEKIAIDTPQAVTVLEQEDIDQAQVGTIGELFETVPGVQAVGSDRVSGQSFNIRGIGALEASDESKIIVNVDGAVKFYEQYRMGSFFSDPELYKSVEVLRGPASSTLYGSGALGGVINVSTKDASDFLEDGQTGAVRLKSGYNSNKDGSLFSPLLALRLNEHAEFLATGNYRGGDNFETGAGNTLSGTEFDAFSGLLKGTFSFGADNEQKLKLSYQRWQNEQDDADYNQTNTATSRFGTVDREIVDQTAVISYENPGYDNRMLDLKLNLSWSDTRVDQSDASLASSPAPGFNEFFSDSSFGYETWAGRIENTFQAVGQSYENFLTIGGQASYQTRTAENAFGAISYHPEGTDTKFGAYIQDEFIWDERLTLISGARLDMVSLDPGASTAGDSEKDLVLFSPKLAALYKFNDVFSVFGSVAHTERAPTLDEMLSTDSGFTPPNAISPDLDPEESNNYEIGFAVSVPDLFVDGSQFSIKTTAFHNDLVNLIETNPLATGGTTNPYKINVAEARIHGIEVEGSFETDRFFTRIGGSIIRGENTETGEDLNSIPADQVSVTVGGRIVEYGLEFGVRSLFVADIDTGTSTLINGVAFDGPFDSYNVHNLFLTWKPEFQDIAALDGLELQAGIDNLFDEYYLNNLAGDPGKGRDFRVSLAKTFTW